MVSVGLIVILIGIIYGYSRKGTEDYIHILTKGALIGLILGIIVAIIGSLIGGVIAGIAGGAIGALLAGLGGFAVFILIIIITVEFIIGVFIGDIIEKAVK